MRLLVVGFDDDVLFGAVEALAESKHEILGAIGEPSPNVATKAKSLGINFETTIPWHRPKFILSQAASYPPVSEKTLLDLRDYESQYLSVTDRLSFFPTTVRLRKNTYFILCALFQAKLEKMKPELILFGSTPHMGWDIVLYAIARRMGIKTLILERTGLPDRLVFLKNYTIQERIPADYMQSNSVEEIKASIAADILAAITTEDSWVKFSKELNSAAKGNPGWIKRSVKHMISLLKKAKRSPSFFGYLKAEHEYSAMFFNHTSRLWADLAEVLSKRTRVMLYRSYDAVSKDVPEAKKYVYFPLHYQPERTTMPLAGDYFEHLLAASTVAHALPDDHILIIKEHPRQFDNIRLTLRTKNFRDEADYHALASLPRTLLAHRGESSAKLIANATAVVSLTGTSGWEALKEGVPVLSFGSPWYSVCRACLKVNSVESVRDQFAAAASMTKQQVSIEMYRMVSFLQTRIFKGSNSARFAQFSTENSNDLSLSLGQAAIEAVESGKYCL